MPPARPRPVALVLRRQVRFGLSNEMYSLLAMRCDAIVHAAAEVNMLKPAVALSPTNVGGTSHVLAFAALGGLPLLFTSTILPLDGAAPTGYRQSKGAAEVRSSDRVPWPQPSPLGWARLGLTRTRAWPCPRACPRRRPRRDLDST